MPTHPYVSRFFVNSDARREKLIYDLPESWWSRPYEYEWCTNFISPHDVVLDAACGISHPLKFYLAGFSDEVYACDLDARILSREAILQNIAGGYRSRSGTAGGGETDNKSTSGPGRSHQAAV